MSPLANSRQTIPSESPIFGSKLGNPSTSSAADLKRATKLARAMLNFSRKRGKVAHTDKSSPFIFRNRSGLKISFSARGIASTVVGDGSDEQFKMDNAEGLDGSENRSRRYEGQFPTVNIKLDFASLREYCAVAFETCRGVSADTIVDLPTDKMGQTVRSVRVWKETPTSEPSIISQRINVVWTVKLEDNRRVLTLSSAANVTLFGCAPAVEVGVRISSHSSEEVERIGSTTENGVYHVPLWVQCSFCQVDVFIRPPAKSTTNGRDLAVYKWSTFPVFSRAEDQWNADATEVHYIWTAEMAKTLCGIRCDVASDEKSIYYPVWMQCAYSEEVLGEMNHNGSGTNAISTTTVAISSAMTIRNMLP